MRRFSKFILAACLSLTCLSSANAVLYTLTVEGTVSVGSNTGFFSQPSDLAGRPFSMTMAVTDQPGDRQISSIQDRLFGSDINPVEVTISVGNSTVAGFLPPWPGNSYWTLFDAYFVGFATLLDGSTLGVTYAGQGFHPYVVIYSYSDHFLPAPSLDSSFAYTVTTPSSDGYDGIFAYASFDTAGPLGSASLQASVTSFSLVAASEPWSAALLVAGLAALSVAHRPVQRLHLARSPWHRSS
jgi:hypothetical protein